VRPATEAAPAATAPRRDVKTETRSCGSSSAAVDRSVKDNAQFANDVVSGVGLLRQGAPDTAKAFGSLLTAATTTKALDTKTKANCPVFPRKSRNKAAIDLLKL
jgi:hypothetical protein